MSLGGISLEGILSRWLGVSVMVPRFFLIVSKSGKTESGLRVMARHPGRCLLVYNVMPSS
jgi:hypothetical protein